jgi:hypothetical protein
MRQIPPRKARTHSADMHPRVEGEKPQKMSAEQRKRRKAKSKRKRTK